MARPGIRRITALLLAFLILGSAAAAINSFLRERERAPYTDDASIDADVVHVAPSVSGRVVQLPIAENQLVKAGDILFVIDPEPFKFG